MNGYPKGIDYELKKSNGSKLIVLSRIDSGGGGRGTGEGNGGVSSGHEGNGGGLTQSTFYHTSNQSSPVVDAGSQGLKGRTGSQDFGGCDPVFLLENKGEMPLRVARVADFLSFGEKEKETNDNDCVQPTATAPTSPEGESPTVLKVGELCDPCDPVDKFALFSSGLTGSQGVFRCDPVATLLPPCDPVQPDCPSVGGSAAEPIADVLLNGNDGNECVKPLPEPQPPTEPLPQPEPTSQPLTREQSDKLHNEAFGKILTGEIPVEEGLTIMNSLPRPEPTRQPPLPEFKPLPPKPLTPKQQRDAERRKREAETDEMVEQLLMSRRKVEQLGRSSNWLDPGG